MNEENQTPDFNPIVPTPAAPVVPQPAAPAAPAAPVVPQPAAPAAPVAPVVPQPAAPAAPAAPVVPQPAAPAAPIPPVAPPPAAAPFVPAAPAAPQPPKKKKGSLLWLWILLGVLAIVGIIVACVFLFGGSGSYKSNPASYLASSTDKTMNTISESLTASPFHDFVSSANITDEMTVDFHLDMEDPTYGDQIEMDITQQLNVKEMLALGDANILADGSSLAFSYYFDNESFAMNFGNEWAGFPFKDLDKQIENSIFADDIDASAFLDIAEEIPVFWDSLSSEKKGFADIDFLKALVETLPDPVLEDVSYDFTGDGEKDYPAYIYTLNADDMQDLYDAFIAELAENPATADQYAEMVEAGTAPTDTDLDLPSDFSMEVTTAFHNDQLAALSISYDGGTFDLLLGENPGDPEQFAILIKDESACLSITRECEDSDLVRDVLVVEYTDLDYDETTNVEIGMEWDKKSGDVELFGKLTANGFPLKIYSKGNLEVFGNKKGFALSLKDLTMQAFGEKETLPLTVEIEVTPDTDVKKLDSYANMFEMTEDELVEWVSPVYESMYTY